MLSRVTDGIDEPRFLQKALTVSRIVLERRSIKIARPQTAWVNGRALNELEQKMLSERKDSRDSPPTVPSLRSLSAYSSSSGQLSSFISVVVGQIEVRSSMSGSSKSDRIWGLLHGVIWGEPSLVYVGNQAFFSSLRQTGSYICIENALERLGKWLNVPPTPSMA